MKRCTKCQEWKRENEFSVDYRYGDNLKSWCRQCDYKWTAEWKKKRRPQLNKYYREIARANKEQHIEPPDTKVCRNCGQEKPASKFHRNFRNKDTLSSYCIECKRKYA